MNFNHTSLLSSGGKKNKFKVILFYRKTVKNFFLKYLKIHFNYCAQNNLLDMADNVNCNNNKRK